ncbi:MAG: hypothetical protein HRT71_13365 [Flavobacteriales bacterium]|nr:hypothetical protein [Flavobacteriales bacterium]
MNFLRKISPPFLKNIDTFLRVNYSWIWATKIHIHLYLTVLLTSFFSIVALIYHIDLVDVPSINDQGGFWGILFVPAFAFLGFMLYHMALFNPDKSGAIRFKYQEFFVFLLYIISFSLPLAIPYVSTYVLNTRIEALADSKQLEEEEHKFQYGKPYFSPYAYNYHYYPNDSLYLILHEYDLSSGRYDYDPDYAKEIDSLIGPELFLEYLSWETMRDSIFYHRGVFKKKRPKLYFQDKYNSSFPNASLTYYTNPNNTYERYTEYQYLDPIYRQKDSIYQLFLENVNINRNERVAIQHIGEFEKLLIKYGDTTSIDKQMVFAQFKAHNYSKSIGHIELYDEIGLTDRNMSNIHRSKVKDSIIYKFEWYILILILVFILTVIYTIYKNVHWTQMLLSIGIIAILITVIAVITVIFRFREEFVLSCAVFFVLFCLALSVKGFWLKRFSWIFSQTNILLTFALPFYLLLVLFYLDEVHDIFEISYFDKFLEPKTNSYGEEYMDYNNEYHKLVSRIWGFVAWCSPIIYLLLWNSYLKTLYLRYWFLPKKT